MDDLISRKDVIELVENSYYNLAESMEDMWAMVADVEKLPSAQLSDLINRQAAIELCDWYEHEYSEVKSYFQKFKEELKELPSIQQNLEKPDRSCRTCYYLDEFLDGVFFCRRVKESKRVKPNFWCKKWRGE